MVQGFGYEQGHSVADDIAADPLMRRDPYLTTELSPTRRDPQIRRAPNSSGLYDVLDLILDKGIVIDAFVRVSLVGIELLTVDLRVVIASVDTYLRYAEGAERLQLYNRAESKRLPDMVGAAGKGSALKKGAEGITKAIAGNGKNKHQDEHDDDEDEGFTGTIKRGVRNFVGKLTGNEDDEEGDEQRQSKDAGRHRGGSQQKQGVRR